MKSEQQRLIAAIFEGEGASGYDPRGLAVYQRNLKASARRSLAISFPTVARLIGEDLFLHAADKLLSESPPYAGDWGLWGADFGDLLDHLPALTDYPYVGDCARLDYAVHMANRAADSDVDVTSLQLLGSEPVDQLRLALNQGLDWLISDYPIVDIWMAHQDEDGVSQRWIKAAQEKIQQGVGQSALIYRPQYRTNVRELGAAELQWLRLLREDVVLSEALESMSHTDFQFEEWLPRAVTQNLILSVQQKLSP